MTTAKRLAALERAAEQAKAARRAAQEAQVERALRSLTDEDVSALGDWLRLSEEDPESVARIHASVQAIARPLDHPAGEAARAWLTALHDTPQDGTLPTPKRGTAEYLEAEAADWDRALHEEASGTEDMRTSARWHAAEFRYQAALARVIGEQP